MSADMSTGIKPWRYRAADATGALTEGNLDAATEQEVVDALRRRDLWAVEVWPRESRGGVGAERSAARRSELFSRAAARLLSPGADADVRAGAMRRVPAGALASVTRAMSTLLASGLPLERALVFAATQAPAGALRDAFTAVRDDVRGGRSLADAVARQAVFPPLYAALTRAGEATGALDDTLGRLATHLERSDELRSRVKTALLYPALLGAAAVIGVTVILLVVVPRFTAMLAQVGGTLPLSTRLLVFVSHAISRGWFIWLPVIVLLTVAVNRWMRVPANHRRWHAWRLSWPVTGPLERAVAAGRYTRTLGLALPTGLGLLPAMKLARGTVDNVALSAELAEAEGRVRDGQSLAQSLGRALPPLATQLLDAGEASGALAALSSRAADAFEGEVEQALTRAVSLVEPVMILGFGGIVGFVALALLQAIYGINARAL